MIKDQTSPTRFVVCVRNQGHPASLELRKIYRVIPDAAAEAHDHLRIVDESGEDYLYPVGYFVPITLPKGIEEAFSTVP
ncbi:MAG: hypothetical protein V3W34_20510 [Phycisphaerae bacterium]